MRTTSEDRHLHRYRGQGEVRPMAPRRTLRSRGGRVSLRDFHQILGHNSLKRIGIAVSPGLLGWIGRVSQCDSLITDPFLPHRLVIGGPYVQSRHGVPPGYRQANSCAVPMRFHATLGARLDYRTAHPLEPDQCIERDTAVSERVSGGRFLAFGAQPSIS